MEGRVHGLAFCRSEGRSTVARAEFGRGLALAVAWDSTCELGARLTEIGVEPLCEQQPEHGGVALPRGGGKEPLPRPSPSVRPLDALAGGSGRVRESCEVMKHGCEGAGCDEIESWRVSSTPGRGLSGARTTSSRGAWGEC